MAARPEHVLVRPGRLQRWLNGVTVPAILLALVAGGVGTVAGLTPALGLLPLAGLAVWVVRVSNPTGVLVTHDELVLRIGRRELERLPRAEVAVVDIGRRPLPPGLPRWLFPRGRFEETVYVAFAELDDGTEHLLLPFSFGPADRALTLAPLDSEVRALLAAMQAVPGPVAALGPHARAQAAEQAAAMRERLE